MSVKEKEKLFDLDLISIPDLPDVSETLLFDKQDSQSEGKKYVVFLLNEKHYAIASDKVSEVVRPLRYTTLPDIPEWLLGIANLRGDIISIINLQNLLNLTQQDSPKSKLIVLSSAKSNYHIAFKVDKVREIMAFPDMAICPNENDKLPFFSGEVELKSNKVTLLNVDNILASLIII